MSGGQFNNEVEFGRVGPGAEITLSGGTFTQRVEFDRSQGSMTVEGGTFSDQLLFYLTQGDVVIRGGAISSFSYSASTTDGYTPILTLIGSNWQFGGAPLSFTDNVANITGQTGLLTGVLADGSAFSWTVGLAGQPAQLLVRNLPTLSEFEVVPAHVLRFQSSFGKSYHLESTEDLENWVQISPTVVDTGGIMNFCVDREKAKEYYRVVAED